MLKGRRVGEEMLKEHRAGGIDVERASCWGIDGSPESVARGE